MEHYIKRLIAEGEHQQLDFKFETSDSKKIARSLAAFANTDGGRLLIGVKDNGKITGVRSEEEAYMIETAAHLYTKPEVTFCSQTHEIEGRVVVEIIVTQSSLRPHYAPDKEGRLKPYIRIKDENKVANKVMTKVWKRLEETNGVYLKFTLSEKTLLSHVEQVGEVSFSQACRITGLNKTKVENILANFIAIGVLEPLFLDHTIKYQIKTSGNFIPITASKQ
jgi:predicted HTH transcriptional regulator